MTPTITHYQMANGQWLAKCELAPAWKRITDEQDKPGAERSLKGHISRHMQFSHEGWDQRT